MKKKYTSAYLPLEGGVWVLKDEFGNVSIPTNMPASLKRPNCRSKCQLSPEMNAVSVFQVGELVRILSYELQ